MTLTNLNQFPPGGYRFFQPEINFHVPKDLAMIGLYDVARALQIARAQNPASGLDPSFEACVEAIKLYTCVRINGDPKFCGPQPAETPKTKRAGCASCGR